MTSSSPDSSPQDSSKPLAVIPNDVDDQDEIDTVETPVRYLGLLGRLRTIVTAQSRLLAFTSEVGEAMRPIIPTTIVNSAYAVSWLYVAGDVGYEGYKMHRHGGETLDVARTVVERGIFQSLASMVLPGIVVHTVVHQSSHFFKSLQKTAANAVSKPSFLARFGPVVLGLSAIPVVPMVLDHPLEWGMEKVFDQIWPLSPRGHLARELHRHLDHSGGHHPLQHHNDDDDDDKTKKKKKNDSDKKEKKE